jgi:hypothetical protein
MMARLVMAAMLVAFASGAFAQQRPTVTSLLKDGYTLAGTILTQAGVGLFLVKGESLFFCVAAETQASADVATRYCKPVR